MTNQIYNRIVEHFVNPDARFVVCVSMGCISKVYAPKHLPTIKPEGNGMRIGKLFVFASQIRFAHMRPVNG